MKKSFYLTGFIILSLLVVFIGRTLSLSNVEEQRTISLQTDTYQHPGDWHIDKSAEWVQYGKAQITF